MSLKRKVLNVGGCSKEIPIPDVFKDYEHTLLDIFTIKEPPDIIMDASEMCDHEEMKEQYDAVYCSHMLEHVARPYTGAILRGFAHVLKPDGFLYIRVPDVIQAIRDMDAKGKEFHQQVYPESDNPVLRAVTYHEIVYGHDRMTEDNPYQRHLQAFTQKSLQWALDYVGFKHFWGSDYQMEIQMIAFKNPPSPEILTLLS